MIQIWSFLLSISTETNIYQSSDSSDRWEAFDSTYPDSLHCHSEILCKNSGLMFHRKSRWFAYSHIHRWFKPENVWLWGFLLFVNQRLRLRLIRDKLWRETTDGIDLSTKIPHVKSPTWTRWSDRWWFYFDGRENQKTRKGENTNETEKNKNEKRTARNNKNTPTIYSGMREKEKHNSEGIKGTMNPWCPLQSIMLPLAS